MYSKGERGRYSRKEPDSLPRILLRRRDRTLLSQTRYYDPETGRFMPIDDISYIDPETINGLNLYAYCGNNPVMNVDPDGNAPWWSWFISGLQVLGGIALCFVPRTQGIGVSLIVGGGLGLISNAVSPAIGQAIGTNYIQQWTGMSDTAYGWTYLGLNLASSVGQIVGRAYSLYNTRIPVYNNKTGELKQYRYYDSKGRKLFDVGLMHPAYGNPKIKFPHFHAWLKNGTRLGINHTGYFIMILELFRRIFS